MNNSTQRVSEIPSDTVSDDNGNMIDLDSLSAWKPPKPTRTKEEWLTELETNPATPNQTGTIMSKFQSLGFSNQEEPPWHIGEDEEWLGRPERLSMRRKSGTLSTVPLTIWAIR